MRSLLTTTLRPLAKIRPLAKVPPLAKVWLLAKVWPLAIVLQTKVARGCRALFRTSHTSGPRMQWVQRMAARARCQRAAYLCVVEFHLVDQDLFTQDGEILLRQTLVAN